MKAFTLIFCLNTLFVSSVWAVCRSCSAVTSMACVSETQYQMCVNGIPTGGINSCPNNLICSTTGPSSSILCNARANNIVPDCIGCNVCDSNRIFACTGLRTYALCLGGDTPSSVTGTCGTQSVCNVNLNTICGDPNLGVTATCPTNGGITPTTQPTPTTTTPSLVTYAQYFCQSMRINSRFPFPTDIDRTCRRYIYCFKTTTGVWSGQIYTCPGSTFFNQNTLYCGTALPTGCSLT